MQAKEETLLQDKDELFTWTCEKRRGARTHTLGDTQAHTHTFTLCLCGLGEPAKLPFLLLSEVSQRDPLVLPTCSSHSQTAEEAVSQYTAEQRTGRDSWYTDYSTYTVTMSSSLSFNWRYLLLIADDIGM